MEIVIATSNRGKKREFIDMLGPLGYTVKALDDFPAIPEIIEDGDSFAENARIKAKAVQAVTNTAVLADDSGLVVDALGGAPGIHSARYAGVQGAERDKANRAKMLQELKGVAAGERAARFVCALVYLDAEGVEHLFEGRCEGRIIDEERGQSGFGYDPIFLDEQSGKTLAEMSSDEKHAVSHRGYAVRAFKEYIIK